MYYSYAHETIVFIDRLVMPMVNVGTSFHRVGSENVGKL